MAFTRTSRTRMYDRVVRVERRHRNRDFMGGTYASYETIIPRYHVRIAPDTHKRRERIEPGEMLSEPRAWRAWGNPAHNGATIMHGDRFIDDKNNQCYDVVSVWRPKGQAGWSLTHQYELRIIEDCPQAVAPVPPGSDDVPFAGVQSHFIMRHFGGDEIQGWNTHPYFDGMVYNLLYETDENIAALAQAVAAGKRYFRYYNVQTYPPNGTEFGGTVGNPPLASWFNYLRDSVQFNGSASHRRMRDGNLVAMFPGFETPLGKARELIPWVDITPSERAALINQMVSMARVPGGVTIPCAGTFTDQSWLKVYDFQVRDTGESGHGETKESQPGFQALDFTGTEAAFGEGGTWAGTIAANMALYAEIAEALATDGQYLIANGEHRTVSGQKIPKPWYLENAYNNPIDGANQAERWANAKAEFVTDPRNVLSILVSTFPNELTGVPEAIAHWQEHGGWIAFTNLGEDATTLANLAAAYQSAADALAQLGWPR